MKLFASDFLKTSRLSCGLLCFILITGLFIRPVYAAGVRCEKVHHEVQKNRVAVDWFSDVAMRIVKMMVSDPTKLRKELKATVNSRLGKEKVQELKNYFGSLFGNRDQAPNGFVNITSTVYMKLGKYTSWTGEERSTKVRFRRYFSQRVGDVLRRFMNPIEASLYTTKMEIKIQHPDLDGVVVKLRIDVPLDDVMALSHSADYSRMREILFARAMKLNPGNHEEVIIAFEYLDAMYSSPQRIHEGLSAHTEYERESYAIKIKPSAEAAARGKKTIEIQITADTKVRLTRIADQAIFDSYSDEQIIYELKIPKDQSELTEADIRDYPDLVKIKEFKEWMSLQRDKSMPDGKGKVSKIRRKLLRDNSKNNVREASENFLVRLGWIEGRYFGSGNLIFSVSNEQNGENDSRELFDLVDVIENQ